MNDLPIRMSTVEAVKYLSDAHGLTIKKATLNKLASVGGGPAFQKFGPKRLYTPQSLDAWARQKLSPTVMSASELREHVAHSCN